MLMVILIEESILCFISIDEIIGIYLFKVIKIEFWKIRIDLNKTYGWDYDSIVIVNGKYSWIVLMFKEEKIKVFKNIIIFIFVWI